MRAPRFIHQHRFDLATDALLISSGLYAAIASVGLTVWWVGFGLPSANTELAESSAAQGVFAGVLSVLMLFAGAIAGPALAWRLHGHALRWRHVIALVATPLLIAILGIVLPLLAALFDFFMRPFTSSEFAGAIAVLVLFAAAYLALIVHAARDAMAPAGDPPHLERLRLFSLTALVVLTLVVAGALALGYASEIGDALIFALLFGFSSAAAVLLAVLVDRLFEPQPKA